MSTTAAFFRVEGVLLKRRALGCAAWMAARQRDVLGRVARVGGALLSRALSEAGDAATATRLAWRTLEGCSEDRLVVLGEQYADEVLADAWNDVGLDLLDRCRRAGDRVVLVSDHPDVALGALLDRLGADEVVTNRLEVVDGRCTGRLVDPVVSGRLDGGWVRRWAARHDVAVARSAAYGSVSADATLLSGVGRPCAVTPSPGLRRLARDFDWPIVEAGGTA
jgi:phosphoserine phosphatase